MAGVPSISTARLIGTLFGEGSVTGMTDEQLLDRFVSERDATSEYAFAVLVQRHGPMVLGVCRSSLRDLHDAEDAFQATFLVLARRASSLREPANLGPWLFGVARADAQKAKARRSRLERLTQRVGAMNASGAASEPDPGVNRQEEARVLHEEIDRLPEKYRTAVILCDLEGRTREEAAQQLGWPIGTVGVRLMRARERLRERLTRRGLGPAGLALFPLVPRTEPLAGSWAVQIAGAALRFATGSAMTPEAISGQVTAIAIGVLKTMAIKKLTIGMTAILACALVAAGSAALAFQAAAKPSKAANPAPPTSQKTSEKKDDAKSILANGGFERGDAQDRAPADWRKGAAVPGVQYGWDRTKAHQGRASLHLKKTAQGYFPIAQWFQEVKREGDTPRLKVVAFVKAQKTTKAILDVQFVDHEGQWTHKWVAYIGAKEAGDPPVTHDWKKYEGVVAIPEGTEKLIVAAQIYGPGEVWFDDVAAEYTSAEATDPLAFNP